MGSKSESDQIRPDLGITHYYDPHFTSKLSAVSVIKVFLCYVLSTICSTLFLLVLMVCATVQALQGLWQQRGSTSTRTATNLGKEERRLKKDLQYYVRLENLDLIQYSVATKDGFRLKMQRIVDGNEPRDKRAKRPPVLMLHGLMQASAAYATSGSDSLALFMFRAGFDIWLVNNRGGFSPSHTTYSSVNVHMWQWGIKEMACYDIPCMVDFVINTTDYAKVTLVAHSQGTTQTFYALARDNIPELGEKLTCFVALSPAVYTGPLLHRWFFRLINAMPRPVYHAFFGHHTFIGLMSKCRSFLPNWIFTSIGYVMFNYLLDWDDSLWNRSYRDRQFLFAPVYVSSELMFWWLGKGGFASRGCIFNEGINNWFDSQSFPPLALFAPGRDTLVDPYALINRLKSYEQVRDMHVFDIPHYSHLDVLWASDAVERVGRPMAAFVKAKLETEVA